MKTDFEALIAHIDSITILMDGAGTLEQQAKRRIESASQLEQARDCVIQITDITERASRTKLQKDLAEFGFKNRDVTWIEAATWLLRPDFQKICEFIDTLYRALGGQMHGIEAGPKAGMPVPHVIDAYSGYLEQFGKLIAASKFQIEEAKIFINDLAAGYEPTRRAATMSQIRKFAVTSRNGSLAWISHANWLFSQSPLFGAENLGKRG